LRKKQFLLPLQPELWVWFYKTKVSFLESWLFSSQSEPFKNFSDCSNNWLD